MVAQLADGLSEHAESDRYPFPVRFYQEQELQLLGSDCKWQGTVNISHVNFCTGVIYLLGH